MSSLLDSRNGYIIVALLALTGIYAGFGVLHLIGINSAAGATSIRNFAEFWQHLDRYMSVRMPPFALLQLAVAVLALLGFRTSPQSAAFWWTVAVVVLLLIDTAHTLTVHVPLNRAIQGWDLAALPSDAGMIRDQLRSAFTVRSLFMIGAFGCTIGATLTRGAA